MIYFNRTTHCCVVVKFIERLALYIFVRMKDVLELNDMTNDFEIILRGFYPDYLSAFTICAWFLTSMELFPKINANNPIFSYNSNISKESVSLIVLPGHASFQVGDTTLSAYDKVYSLVISHYTCA